MPKTPPKTIRFRRREEPVLQTFRVRGRNYFALEKLSRRGAFRVFDPHAGPHGDYRVLYQLKRSQVTEQKLEVLRRFGGPTGNTNFPSIVDFARQKDEVYVVLDWAWGTTMKEYLAQIRNGKTPRPSVSEVVRLFRGLAHGLGHYHRKMNLVHGDISPANIVIASGTSRLVLVDFGSAWPVEDVANKVSGDGATLRYAAPERLNKTAAEDLRSDMFSMSVVAYELLTLKLPYDGLAGRAGTIPSEEAADLYEPPSGFIDRKTSIPKPHRDHLDACLHRGLQLTPSDRFPTRKDWLSTWDALHDCYRNRSELTTWQSRVADALGSLAARWTRDK